jgi:hypothetical protein
MRPLVRLALLPIAALLLCGWTPRTEERIAKKAAQLAPPDLRFLIEKYEPLYLEGVRQAAAAEAREGHHFTLTPGAKGLQTRIDAELAAAVGGVKRGDPMSALVRRLGVLSHLVADANNPFLHDDSDQRLNPSRADFESYLDRRLEVMPTVFYGLDRSFKPDSYLRRTFERTASLRPLLTEEYFRGGERRRATEFDDRSTAFGIASICYSRSVTDLVNVYFYVWREAGGDIRVATAMYRGNLLLNSDAD